MTFEECINRLPDELISLGYKMSYGKVYSDVTVFYLDVNSNHCLIRIIDDDIKTCKCICYVNNIRADESDYTTCFYNDFNDTIYENIIDAAKNLVAQYKKYIIDLKMNEISKDFV